MKIWEILNEFNIGKFYERIDRKINYKYKVEIREDGVLELISYSSNNDRMGVVQGNSMTFKWIFREFKSN